MSARVPRARALFPVPLLAWILGLAVSLSLALPAPGAFGPAPAFAKDKDADAKKKEEEKKKKEEKKSKEKGEKEDEKKGGAKNGQKPFSEVTKDAEKIEGFVTLYRSKDKIFAELPDAMFDKDFCLVAQNVAAIGDWSGRGSEVGTGVVHFERWGDRIALVKKNLSFTARPDVSIRHAVDATFPDSPILVTAIETSNPDGGAAVADIADLFGSGTFEILSRRSGWSPEGEPSILSIHDNPENLTVRVAYHFKRSPNDREGDGEGSGSVFGGSRGGPGRLADPRHVQVTVQYDLFRLPENGYHPRESDDRLGFFDEAYKDYTGIDDRDTAFRYRAARWNVEKTDPAAAVSPAKKPIVFYIDKATPAEVRPLIREGALWWNDAFEAVGVSGVVEVRDQPDDADWHPTDIRYSMIYWNLSDDLNFSGLAGPSLVNPLTGEVLKANVYLNAEFLSYTRHRYLVYAWWRAPQPGEWERGEADAGFYRRTAAARAGGLEARSILCDYSPSFSSQLAFARLVLQSRGQLPPGSADEDRYAREAFVELSAHEVGHALGFGHNFKASRVSSYADIASGVEGKPFSASVMDYNPINLPPKGKPAGQFFLHGVGAYDRLAVEYLYRPFHGLSPAEEAKALDAIAARAETEPGLAFDDGTLADIDPTSNTDDLGDDALRFADDRLGMAAEVLPRVPELILSKGQNYNVLRQALDAAIISVSMDYLDIATRHVGGQQLLRLHNRMSGEAARGAAAPIRPVSPATQREALALIDRRLFADDAFVVGPEFLNLLQADLSYDWNYPYRYGSDYLYESRLAYLAGTTMAGLLSPERLARVKDNEARTAPGENPLTIPELLDTLSDGVFRGLESGNVSATGGRSALAASKRRTFQRIYVGLLSDLALSPDKGTPPDASVVAAAELRGIRDRARRAGADPAVAGKLDGYGRAHLADLDSRIARVFDARIELPASAR